MAALALCASCGLIGYDDAALTDVDGAPGDATGPDAEPDATPFSAQCDDFEPNDDPESAFQIDTADLEAGYTIDAAHCGPDVDYYGTNFTQGGDMSIFITVSDGTADQGQLAILDSDGSTVLDMTGTFDTGSTGFSTFVPGLGQKYFRVDAVDGSDWDYQIQFQYFPGT